MKKWLKYNHILREICLKLNQEDILEMRTISEEFNKLFENYVKIKTIKFNWEIKDKDLYIVEKYNILNVDLESHKLHELNFLTLSPDEYITDDDLKYLSNCTNINLSWRDNITGEGLIYLTNCVNIDLSYCKNITDNDIQILFNIYEGSCLSNYTTINLCNTNITDESLKYLSNYKKINLSYCRNITGNGLKYLKKAEIINIASTGTEENLIFFLENYLLFSPNLETVYTCINNYHKLNLINYGDIEVKSPFLDFLGKITF